MSKATKVLNQIRFHKSCPLDHKGRVAYVTVHVHAMWKAGQIKKKTFTKVVDKVIRN